jgi:hypothetical protein
MRIVAFVFALALTASVTAMATSATGIPLRDLTAEATGS